MRGPLIDYFLDLRSDLQIQRAVARADREYDDCALIDPDCYEKTATVTVDTVRGQRSDTYQRNECIGATIGCLPGPVRARRRPDLPEHRHRLPQRVDR